MPVKSSALSNGSLLLSSVHQSLPFGLDCLLSEPQTLVFTTYTIISILLLLPLCILVLYHGFQRWQQRCSVSPAANTSHSDSFTYNLVTMEILAVFGCSLCCCGIYIKDSQMLCVGFYFFSLTWYGETFFHVLTCVEHYLAVVHPITYLSLRKERWIRIRNMSIGCVWLLCFVGTGLCTLENISLIVLFCLLPLCLMVISFCCLSVLYVLIRPGPGEQGRNQERVDQSKQRAFYRILAILVVLLLRCTWNMIWALLYALKSVINECDVVASEVWFSVLSSLVLPLLFLQKVGMLKCLKQTTNNNKN